MKSIMKWGKHEQSEDEEPLWKVRVWYYGSVVGNRGKMVKMADEQEGKEVQKAVDGNKWEGMSVSSSVWITSLNIKILTYIGVHLHIIYNCTITILFVSYPGINIDSKVQAGCTVW